MAGLAMRPTAALHDMELVTLAAGGDHAAFGELARRHVGGVRALLRRMGAEASMAEDLAQDAFLTAFERIADFRGEGAFASWIKRIAARLYVRRSRRRIRLEDSVSLDAHDLADSMVARGTYGGTYGGADGGAADRDKRIDLDAALAVLSPSERLCVALCFGAGLTHAEVAESLGAPLGTVKSHVKRGLAKLRRQLDAPAPVSTAQEGSAAP